MKRCVTCNMAGFSNDERACPSCGGDLVEASADDLPGCYSGKECYKGADNAGYVPYRSHAAQCGDGGSVGMNLGVGFGSSVKKIFGGKKGLVAIGVLAVVLVVAAVVIVLACVQTIPSDRVKQDVLASSLVKNGVVSSRYVNESEYELSSFRVEDQVESTEYFFDTPLDVCTVTFSGKVRNANFESEFTGSSVYVKEGDQWVEFSGPSVDSSSTKPLKGVDFISGSESDEFTVFGFSSTFEEDGGLYVSTATEEVKYEFWFADDTATNCQTFVFDSDTGWQAKGDVEVVDMKTAWKLEGRSFTATELFSLSFLSGPVGSCDATLNFVGVDEGSLAVDYVVDFKNTQESNSWATYNDCYASGKATGVPSKKFGENSFTVELNDSENDVTISCKNTGDTTVAGSGTVNALRSEIVTNYPYRVDPDDGSTVKAFEFGAVCSEVV